MTQEEKDLIHKDACGRILYKPYAAYEFEGNLIQVQITGMEGDEPTSPFYGQSFDTWGHIPHDNVRLYLRPMSSMTKEEKEIYRCLSVTRSEEDLVIPSPLAMQWLLSRHFDINHLIEKELALMASEGMYKI